MKDVRVATATDVEKLESRMEMLEARLETHSHDEEAGESGA
jgi:BMFP domain-containing protein YqiC